MKLSEKGIEKIHHNCRRMIYVIAGDSGKPGDYTQYEGLAGAEDLEFERNDFKDCVVLTVKEAKEILQSSYDVLSWSMVGPTHRDNAVYVQRLLKHHIEQAENL